MTKRYGMRCGTLIWCAAALPAVGIACGWPGDGEFAAAARLEPAHAPTDSASVIDGPRSAPEMTALGHRYRTGRGLAVDLRKAAGWYRRAAQLGDPEAQYTLALMLDSGGGVTPAPSRARYWYRRAAAQGNVHAQHHLAEMLRDGRGGRSDRDEAMNWFLRAAESGHTDVYGPLARLYWRSSPRQPVQAYIWLRRAAMCGAPGDDALLQSIEKTLAAPDRRRAEAALSEPRSCSGRAEVELPSRSGISE